MAKPRLPRAKAALEGRDKINPSRFKDRNEPKVGDGLGDPPVWFGPEAATAWQSFKIELPWLNHSHRSLVEIASGLRARLIRKEDVGVQALNLLRQCLAQMGATPADASKVSIPNDDEKDPDDALFE